MTTAALSERTRRATDRATVLLAAGDIVLIAGLIVFGQLSHETNPIAEPLASLESIAPFVLGWVVAALLAGVYARTVVASPARAARVTAIAWIAAANLGLLLRSSPAFDGGAPWPFNLIITATGLSVLVAWRVGYAAYAGSDSGPGSAHSSRSS